VAQRPDRAEQLAEFLDVLILVVGVLVVGYSHPVAVHASPGKWLVGRGVRHRPGARRLRQQPLGLQRVFELGLRRFRELRLAGWLQRFQVGHRQLWRPCVRQRFGW
jgi:hypothetical protein